MVFYNRVRQSGGGQEYLSQVTDPRERKAMCRMLLGGQDLNIESGRYEKDESKKEVRSRCSMCDRQARESEQHMIVECKAYKEVREKWLSDEIKKKGLVHEKDAAKWVVKIECKDMARCIYEMLKKRKEYLRDHG